ncbi:AMP-binding protein (plasmid) [Paraburkholderia sprentiae WSM5005]|uniref:AMP-binding protein n=1 Tax=Paraburkholderia sprentiae WSM5005 TaxID=754502 RepID=A0A1I9YW71_9BURK|nr:AMP-binding protein [Paraburkholderia sprentiae]APA90469.1 AMP-binding protein [Paraburkholderia sprentiae WSM5005]
MDIKTTLLDPRLRVTELVSQYSDPSASVAWLLCDRHNPQSVAYEVVDATLEAKRLTYGELKRQSEAFAAGLASLGIGKGDRVATLAGKSQEFLIALMAIWRLGAVHVPLFTAFAQAAIALRLAGSHAKVVICDSAQAAKLAPGEDTPENPSWRVVVIGGEQAASADPLAVTFESVLKGGAQQPVSAAASLGGDAPFIHIFTSGTTGRPKAVVVPIRALATFHSYVEFGIGVRDDDVYWCAADPGWGYGLYFGVIGSLCTGVHSVLLKAGFEPLTTYRVLVDRKVTNFAAAPTVYRSLLCSEIEPPPGLALRCASSAGEPLTPDVNEWAVGALGVEVFDHYGQTEAGMLINNHHDPRLARPVKAGSMGVAMPGWKAVVLDRDNDVEVGVGEVGRVAFELTESPLAWFKGYEDDSAKSAERFAGDGRWYLSGDLGRVDEDGYFFFSSREDDVIIMAGYRIGPFEVESVIAAHPDVAECAVIAVPDKVRGEVIEAYVVLRRPEKAGPEMEHDIQQWVKTRYAAHAYPRQVHFSAELPKTPSGKIQRFVLREQRKKDGSIASIGAGTN